MSRCTNAELSVPRLELVDVSKSFGNVFAVRGACAKFEPGSICAIVGENGAGKSTLISIASGAIVPNSGRVLVGDSPLVPHTSREAIRRGIGFVHQHFMLVEAFSALENIVLGHEPMGFGGVMDMRTGRSNAEAAMRDLGLSLNLDARVSDMGVGERQSLEIVRVLVRGARIIFLDEPTALLTSEQAKGLHQTLRRMADSGACIVVVTHRLSEVFSYCDHVVVVRRGLIVSSRHVSDTSMVEITRDIMGCDPPAPMERPVCNGDSAVGLELRGIRVSGVSHGRNAIEDISISVRSGWIIGIAGVDGNGQREFVSAIAGTVRIAGGQVMLCGRDITTLTVAERRAAGLSVVHEDRHLDGLMLDVCVSDNLVLGDLMQTKAEAELASSRIGAYGIVPSDPGALARSLSGGNQQKVVIARALDRRLVSVVLSQPTRGVDLGAARRIHCGIFDAARGGAAVVVVSADLSELRAICHEIYVISRGRLVGVFSPDAPEAEFGKAMLCDVDGEVAA
ncbi:MAG: ATP-binding cassette domain-containing protein [Polyangiaceae bacterium]|nr:ATP-binding cassette domain-containing protein [Polyangiaceae bacterium]